MNNIMRGIYLGAYKAYHPNYDIVYQDINGLRDIPGDMMDIKLDNYDFVIATPPCNFWSRCNHNPSEYAIKTAHLLPDIIDKLSKLNIPFIVENVRSERRFYELGLFSYKNIYVYRIGRHTYWSSIPFNSWIYQVKDYDKFSNPLHDNDQGGENVHRVIEKWLYTLHNLNYN